MTPAGGDGADGSESGHRPVLGVGLAVLTAGFYGLSTTFARVAYDTGATPVTVILARTLAAACLFAAVLALAGRTAPAAALAAPRAAWGRLAPMPVLLALQGLGYLGAVAFIPVGLAALLFYTFPLMVAAVAPLTGGPRPGRRQGLAFVAAFAGLALALGPQLQVLDPRGIALALTGAVGQAGLMLCGARAAERLGPLRLSFHTNLLALPLFALALVLLGGPSWPGAAAGWAGFGGVMAVGAVAVVAMFAAARAAGPARAALVLNLEPLVSIAAAALLLDERLSPQQMVGAAVVLSALLLAALPARRRARGAP
ncbi:MAG: DMT family transporter [Hyphomicrobiales bacterium]|nr:DMT family transporter [Hyphomicrobiales bacterium]